MKQLLKSVAAALAAATWLCANSGAAQLPSRIAGQIDTSERVEIAGTATHRPATSTVVGQLPGNTQLTRMGLVLAPSAAQEADLEQLLADQVNPSSPHFHQWLTPAQFGARFGVSAADLTKIEGWLTSQGFDIVSVPASRNTVFFSGTAATVESAFAVSMEQYRRNGQVFFENSSNIKIPAALNGIVRGVTSLSSYRLKGNLVARTKSSLKANIAKPQYTDTSGDHSLTPWDFRQIYSLNSLVNAGYTGNVKIAVVGQSAVDTTQIGYFRQLTGQTNSTFNPVLVPNSGTSTEVSGDESESEIDIEYAGGTASGANIQFVYTGNGQNNGVFDSVIYAVTTDIAPIITMSYGGCETDYTTYASQTFEPYLQQANSQGQTVLVSAGDEDAATCDVVDSSTGAATIASEGATVSYPASSPYVTAVGGTRFDEGSGDYWNSTNNSFGGSATGYIPEIVWNETNDPNNISQNNGVANIVGTGGGASALFGKPSWQTGTGVPSDGQRDLPDVAFDAAVYNDSYNYCSADTINGSGRLACTASTFGGLAGGTSFSAPNFAGMLAIVEQKNAVTGGLGNINPAIYSLAAGSSSSAVFNDVTSGNNIVPCIVGTPDCTSGTLGYVAGVGYDQTTGWGSVNGAAFATALAAQVAPAKATPIITVSATPAGPIINTAVTLTAAVTSASTTTVPTGTVQFTIDGASVGSETIASGSATYTVSAGFTTAGTHTVVATYSGDGNYGAATSTLDLIVGASVSTSGTFSLASSPATLSISSSGSGAETITVTPAGGFLGVVSFVATESGSSALNACYALPNATVAAGGGSATLSIFTSTADCATAGRIPIRSVKTKLAANAPSDLPNLPRKPAAILLGGALLGCFALRRRSRLPLLFMLAFCAALIPGMGCGSGGSTSPISGGGGSGGGTTTTGTNYTITVTGASSTNASLTSSTSFTLNIQ